MSLLDQFKKSQKVTFDKHAIARLKMNLSLYEIKRDQLWTLYYDNASAGVRGPQVPGILLSPNGTLYFEASTSPKGIEAFVDGGREEDQVSMTVNGGSATLTRNSKKMYISYSLEQLKRSAPPPIHETRESLLTNDLSDFEEEEEEEDDKPLQPNKREAALDWFKKSQKVTFDKHAIARLKMDLSLYGIKRDQLWTLYYDNASAGVPGPQVPGILLSPNGTLYFEASTSPKGIEAFVDGGREEDQVSMTVNGGSATLTRNSKKMYISYTLKRLKRSAPPPIHEARESLLTNDFEEEEEDDKPLQHNKRKAASSSLGGAHDSRQKKITTATYEDNEAELYAKYYRDRRLGKALTEKSYPEWKQFHLSQPRNPSPLPLSSSDSEDDSDD